MKSGVPQGSVLRPSFYLLYVESIPLAELQVETYKFADAILYKGKYIQDLQKLLNNELKY